jgi:hypothetical protein
MVWAAVSGATLALLAGLDPRLAWIVICAWVVSEWMVRRWLARRSERPQAALNCV